MPEKLQVYSGERIDLVDYVHGANDYTANADKFTLERTWLDRRARILEGFRVRIEDQTVSPGMVTVFNGNALNREGQLVNNEQVVNDSRSVTLLGPSQTFYIEIEFVENKSDTDARFFWDPSATNTPPALSGSEFGLNVATRLTPDWRIVSPVSTTGFEQATDPNSKKIPLAVLVTDGSNRISVGPTNPGLSLVRAASIIESDITAGATAFRVLDARVFPATLPFTVNIGVGSGVAEARTVTALDPVNGICTVSVPLANNHAAGAIVQVSSGLAEFVKERVDPSDPSGHPDPAQRFWQANEVRGSAVEASKESFGSRDDLNVRNLKDYVDFLSAQLRELKFGSPRPEVVNAAPPTAFGVRPRYFDAAGGVQGARTNSVSIGNGTTTFGDFNGTDLSVSLSAAIAALPALGGTIFVKAGTYTLGTAVAVTKTVRIVGEGIGSTIVNVTNAAGAGLVLSATTTFENLTIQAVAGAATNTIDVTAAITVGFSQAVFVGQVKLDNATASVRAYRASFTGVSVNPVFLGDGTGSLINSEFISSLFTGNLIFLTSMSDVSISGAAVTAVVMVGTASAQSITDLRVTETKLTVSGGVLATTGTGDVDGVFFDNCRITVTALAAGSAVFSFVATGTSDRLQFTNLVVLITGGSSSTAAPAYVLAVVAASSSRKVLIDNLDVDAEPNSVVRAIYFDQKDMPGKTEILNSYFYRTQEMLRIGGTVGNMTTRGMFLVDGCVHENANRHDDVQGIVLNANPEFRRLEVLNSSFNSYGKSLGTGGVRIGINLANDSTPLGETTYVVRGCFFYDLWGSGATTAAGVYYTSTTGTNACFQISENNFETIAGDTTHISAGVYISHAANTVNVVQITNNHMVDIGRFGSGNAYGVYVSGAANIGHTRGSVNITGNRIRGVNSSSVSSPASGIEVRASGPALIQNNYIDSCAAPAGTLLLTGCGIRVVDASSLRGLNISNNRIEQNTGGAASNQGGTIICNVVNLNEFVISGNLISTSTAPLPGVHVVGQSSSAICNGTIADNIVRLNATSQVDARAINVSLGGLSRNVSISGNVIEETTYDGTGSQTRKGIVVAGNTSGGTTRNISVRGNILLGPKAGALIGTGARVGIRVQDAHSTVIADNIVDWLEPGVLEGVGINLRGFLSGPWEGHTIVGNVVRADGTSAVGDTIMLELGAAVIDGVITGNCAGTTAAPGTITAGAGGWVYGSNKT